MSSDNLTLIKSNLFLKGFSREIANLATRADSENENHEITPDTDTDSQEHMTKHSMPPPHASQTSFKRAPVMGTRIDARNSKRSSQRKTPLGNANQPVMNQPQVQQQQQQPVVGALEVQNVKRAINRYGTLPKSSRIGAYLESLRQNGENESPSGVVPPATAQQIAGNVLGIPSANEILPSTHSPRTALKVQPQMIRSNSSGGVTNSMTNSATASLTKLQRHRTTTDGTMMTTFSSFRSTGNTNSPKRNMQPALADLEFPPPPPPG